MGKVFDRFWKQAKVLSSQELNALSEHSKLSDVLKGIPANRVGEFLIVDDRGYGLAINRHGHIFEIMAYLDDPIAVGTFPLGVIIDNGKKCMVVRNGDINEDGDINGATLSIPGPLLSFRCLSRFSSRKLRGKLDSSQRRSMLGLEMVCNGLNEILDWTDEEWSDVHKPGFTKLQDSESRWHRPGSVLWVSFSSNAFKYVLFGQDDDVYFGCELPGECETITQAYRLLMPKSACRVKEHLRQGEWFVVPCHKPDMVGCMAIGRESRIELPGESDESVHVVHVNNRGGEDYDVDDDRCVIINNGQIYIKGPFAMVHSQMDYPELVVSGSGWYEVVRNRAVRSFSEKGVDPRKRSLFARVVLE